MPEPRDRAIYIRIGGRLRALRREQNMTQAELSAAAGVDQRHYQDLEAGKVDVKISMLQRLAEFHQVTVTSFFHWDVEDLLRVWLPPRGLLDVTDNDFSFDRIPQYALHWKALEVPVSVIDRSGLFRYVNPAWERHWGRAADVVNTRHVWEQFADERVRDFVRASCRFVVTGEAPPVPMLLDGHRTASGGANPVKIDWEIIRDDRDKVCGVITLSWCVSSDIALPIAPYGTRRVRAAAP